MQHFIAHSVFAAAQGRDSQQGSPACSPSLQLQLFPLQAALSFLIDPPSWSGGQLNEMSCATVLESGTFESIVVASAARASIALPIDPSVELPDEPPVELPDELEELDDPPSDSTLTEALVNSRPHATRATMPNTCHPALLVACTLTL
jgi:hypothetical protein